MVALKTFIFHGRIFNESFALSTPKDVETFCDYYEFPKLMRSLITRGDYEEQLDRWYLWKLMMGIDFSCRIVED